MVGCAKVRFCQGGVARQGAGSGKDARTNGKIHGRVTSAGWMDDSDTTYKKHNLENGEKM